MEHLRAIIEGVFNGTCYIEDAIEDITTMLYEAYESGWDEATHGKWGPSENNPWIDWEEE